jgi:hypothetical protein
MNGLDSRRGPGLGRPVIGRIVRPRLMSTVVQLSLRHYI